MKKTPHPMDPDAPPEPYESTWPGRLFSSDLETTVTWPVVCGGLLVLAGAGWLFLQSAATHHVHGAGRSTRLQWEQRQKEIEAVIQEANPEPEPAGGTHAQVSE